MSAHQPRYHFLTVYEYIAQEASDIRLDIWYARDAKEACDMLARDGVADAEQASVFLLESAAAHAILTTVLRPGYVKTLLKAIPRYTHWSFRYGKTT